MMGRGPILLFATLLIASLLFIGYLGRTVISDLEALSTAQNDDISWGLSQLEVELLNVQVAASRAEKLGKSHLSKVRRRYDIFYSRVETISQSAVYRRISIDNDAKSNVAALRDFRMEITPIIDGSSDALMAALPMLQSRIDEVRPSVRALALSGVQSFAVQDDMRRAELSDTLIKLAFSIVALVSILLLAMIFFIKLMRHGQRISQDNQVMRARFEAAVTSSLDAVLVVDKNGQIIEFNGAAETVFGYSRAEALEADMASLIIPEPMRDAHRHGMQRFLTTGEQKVIGAGRIRLEGLRKSGETFPVELSISLSEADGELVCVSFLRDITAELEAEEALRSARDKAQESERAKSDLLTVMSHEMRTPLNGILGSLALIDQQDLDDRQKRHLNSIAVSGELLLSHVNDVLDLSSLSSDKLLRDQEEFDLSKLVQSVGDSLRANAIARSNQLTVDCLTDGLGSVLGYKTSLQQCLINLVGNAIKFTADGVVTVEVERIGSEDLVEIRVSDTGVGIAPENLNRIFEEFVTIDTAFARENAGTGLGLAITKRLVETMNGSIEVDSLLGEGSLFTLRLPLPVTVAQGNPVASGSDTPTRMHLGRSALAVDDNEINRMILTDMLQDLGFVVVEAADGFEAIAQVSERSFDVVLLDISMPGIDGMETLRRIRALDVPWRDVPAMAVTAHAAPKDHARIRQAPFADLLVKPVNMGALQAKLADMLGVTRVTEPIGAPQSNEYKDRFGEEKYRAAMQTFATELSALVETIEPEAIPSQNSREIAHKLAGSASILGETEIWALLQTIEHTTADEWSISGSQTLGSLGAAVARIRD